MKVNLHFEDVSHSAGEVPDAARFQQWAEAALADEDRASVSFSVRVVDEAEIQDLNQRYRNKPKPTNVLSFPFEDPPGVVSDELGDVVLCAPVVCREAEEQGKELFAHWAHLLVHGILHLLGRDHQTDEEAGEMEREEVRILAGLGYPDPY